MPLWEVSTGTWGQNLEAGTKAEAMEMWRLLTCSSWLAQRAFVCTPVPLFNGDITQMGGTFHINHQSRKRLFRSSPTGLSWDIFPGEDSFLQMTLANVKLTKYEQAYKNSLASVSLKLHSSQMLRVPSPKNQGSYLPTGVEEFPCLPRFEAHEK